VRFDLTGIRSNVKLFRLKGFEKKQKKKDSKRNKEKIRKETKKKIQKETKKKIRKETKGSEKQMNRCVTLYI
jgi:hypothetical protein